MENEKDGCAYVSAELVELLLDGTYLLGCNSDSYLEVVLNPGDDNVLFVIRELKTHDQENSFVVKRGDVRALGELVAMLTAGKGN